MYEMHVGFGFCQYLDCSCF